jgi:hypothetical protein
MSLSLYRHHTSKCSQGRSRHERTYESNELRRGFKKCQCPIQFEGTVKGIGLPSQEHGEDFLGRS